MTDVKKERVNDLTTDNIFCFEEYDSIFKNVTTSKQKVQIHGFIK